MAEQRFVAVLKVHKTVRHFIARCQAQEPLEEIHPLLVDVVDAMPGHFDEEENPGGFFDAIVDLGIVAAYAVKHLKLDHGDLRVQARDLLAHWATRSAAENRRHLDHFAEDLGNHELVESYYADEIESVLD
ncbi:MAG: hypothetical protein GXP62_20975 [Oligoflexia bacterium]|nr:hypothetical protein [Oligoflexia bacterium]